VGWSQSYQDGHDVWLCDACRDFVHLEPGKALYGAEVAPKIEAAKAIFDHYHMEGVEAAFLGDVLRELARARMRHAPLNSLHEAYAVILEEVDELWDICRQKAEDRQPVATRKELVQIAAMAFRAAIDLHMDEDQ